jgi:hypothetical protein
MIKSAVNRGTTIPMDSRRAVLMGYQYALHQHKKELLQEKSELKRSHKSNSATNRTQWDELSDTSQSSEERHHEPKHNRRRAEPIRKESRTQNSSFLSVDETGSIMPEMLEAALVVAQAYFITTCQNLVTHRKACTKLP